MLDPDERGGGGADRLGRDPEQERHRDRGQGVRQVVPAGQGQLVEGHDPALGPGRRETAAGQLEAFHAVGHDPAVDDAQATRRRSVEPVADDPRRTETRVAGHDRIVQVEHQRAGRIDRLGEPALDRAVRLERAVPVEMIRGDVGQDGDGRAPRQGRQLQLGQLDHDPVVGSQVGQALDQRPADVAAEDGPVPRVGGQQGVGQGGGRRLALGPADPDGRRRAEPQDQVRLGHDRRRVGIARRPSGDQRRQGRPEAWLGRRVVGVDGRRGRHQGGARQGLGRVDLGTGQEPDRAPVEASQRLGQLVGRTPVVDGHDRAGIDQEAGQGDPAPGEAQDAHRTTGQRAGPDRVQRQRVRVERRPGVLRRGRGHRGHASELIEAMNRVTPSRPARTATIQSRTVIFSSFQPSSSK